MPKPTTDADRGGFRFVIVTLDHHLESAADRARMALRKDMPNLTLSFHAAADWDHSPERLQACIEDIARADVIVATMLFMEEHVKLILPALQARRDHCLAIAGCMSAPEIVKLTRLGRFNMDGTKRGALDFLKKLRGSEKKTESSGARQMAMLRRLPRILRFIPGPAQDVRAYFLTLQYWLGSSDENVANMVRMLASRYAGAQQAALRKLKAPLPVEYPENGVYHPRMPGRIAKTAEQLPRAGGRERRPRIGLLMMRSYILAKNTAHYDAVISALEARGLDVVPAFASGLDARPAIDKFFKANGKSSIDALVSLTGFSLVGGPAYNDARGAETVLADLDIPYIAAHALEFQTLEQWEESERGLSPVEATLMVAIPELDGATAPMVFGGRTSRATAGGERDMIPHVERINRLTDRIARMVALRRKPQAERNVAIVLFNFPPNAGSTGTAAFLSVFESLHNVMKGLKREGYDVEVPASVDELRKRVLEGNASRFGADANVHARIPTEEHVRREIYLSDIERQWGPAPGKQLTDGGAIQVLGERFGKIFVGIQPSFGYEGDPMRLLFERSFTPTHAFSAFYRYLRDDFSADAILHFGTHGALEFMPGKQTGLSSACWPDRLIAATPNVYLYAANNPSEGAIAKRRSSATLVSYLTPSLSQAGLYRGLLDLKGSLERFRTVEPEAQDERTQLAELIRVQAAEVNLETSAEDWAKNSGVAAAKLSAAIIEVEYSLIPHGLHIAGVAPSSEERIDTLETIAEATYGLTNVRPAIEAIVNGATPDQAISTAKAVANDANRDAFDKLKEAARLLTEDHEIPALLRALDGRFIRPVAGGDLLRTPEILPTGRNIHGFDPFRIPSAFAMADGARQAERVLKRYQADGNVCPESVAVVLWGTDNLKSEGSAIAQVLALLGAKPRFDGYGRLCGAELIPLAELGRPRIDVVVTLSGIFRDLMPLQTKLLAEAAWLAASADEPLDMNFVRKHALAECEKHKIDLETAALRVFSNADGAYGSNVGMLIESSAWTDDDELSETFSRRKSFAYGRNGKCASQQALFQGLMGSVDFAYQNLDSVELGVTTIDHYFDSLGGIGRAVTRARGGKVAPIYISDQTRGEGKVRSLTEQVALETRTRILNPKWYEGMLRHGYEGVRQIEAHVTNTMGWSATTGQVDAWVYEQITRTYVLDSEMRARMAALNPVASVKMTHRIIEAHQRGFWQPDESMLKALQDAGDELEDRIEGVSAEIAA